jgi:hypothetical protein
MLREAIEALSRLAAAWSMSDEEAEIQLINNFQKLLAVGGMRS